MIQGTIQTYDPRRGTGFLSPAQREDRFPFVVRPDQAGPLSAGDTVEFSVGGGRAGLLARDVRRVRSAA